jgi:hypothetical protein
VHGASSSSSDSRLKALYAMQAAQTLFSPGAGNAMHVNGTGLNALENTPSALKDGYAQGAADTNGEMGGGVAGGAQGAGKATGISLHIGIGGGSSTSTSKTHDDVTYGSQINSNGNVTIAAAGGDLNVIGSQINGKNVALSATNNINLLSQAEQHTDSNSSHNASGEVGLSIGQTTGIYLSVAAGEAIAHGNGTTHTDSVVNAKDTLTLLSGNDTTIKGAQATGNTVLANIGGNLNIASEQDTNDYASHSIQGGLTLVYGWSGSGVGVSGNLALSKANSNYASVTKMSGIGAGNGGFDITVGGNTDLKGAVIASSAGADKNILDTGSLTYSNIQNQAKSSAESISVGGGYGTGSMSGMTGFSPGIGIPQNSNKSSTTQAGIAQGSINVRNNLGQDLSGLNRNPSLSDANGLTNNFDPNKVAQNLQAGMLAGQVGMTAAGDLASYMESQAVKNGDKAQAQSWSDGGADKTILHATVGAATAALGGGNALQGALGAGLSEAATNLQLTTNPMEQQLLSTGIGALVGGGSGAATALAGTIYNDQHHFGDYQKQLQACQQNPSGSGCGTILQMNGDTSVPLSMPDNSNSTGVIANINSQTGQVVSYTITNAQNQPIVIMQSSDYQRYVALESAGYSWASFNAGAPEYALQAANFMTDFGQGQYAQAGGNLAGWFTNGAYWRDMAIGMAMAAGGYASSLKSGTGLLAEEISTTGEVNASSSIEGEGGFPTNQQSQPQTSGANQITSSTVTNNRQVGKAAEQEVSTDLANQGTDVQQQVTLTNGSIRCQADCALNGAPNQVVSVPAGYVAEDINGNVLVDVSGNPVRTFNLNSQGQAVVEVKTGQATLTTNQSAVYPAVQSGAASGTGAGTNAAKASMSGPLQQTPVIVLRKL